MRALTTLVVLATAVLLGGYTWLAWPLVLVGDVGP